MSTQKADDDFRFISRSDYTEKNQSGITRAYRANDERPSHKSIPKLGATNEETQSSTRQRATYDAPQRTTSKTTTRKFFPLDASQNYNAQPMYTTVGGKQQLQHCMTSDDTTKRPMLEKSTNRFLQHDASTVHNKHTTEITMRNDRQIFYDARSDVNDRQTDNYCCSGGSHTAAVELRPVSYTHLTLPTNREV